MTLITAANKDHFNSLISDFQRDYKLRNLFDDMAVFEDGPDLIVIEIYESR